MLKDFDKLLNVTKVRHSAALYAVAVEDAVVGKKQQDMYMDGLSKQVNECIVEKNSRLIHYDIMVSMRNVYNEVKDETIREKTLALIASEKDTKNPKKYAGVWHK